MKAKFTELAFILDRSGSMGGLEGDTIGGYNAMLAKQRAAAGEARITTVLFDDRYELLHNRADIRSAAPITEREYFREGLHGAAGCDRTDDRHAHPRTAERGSGTPRGTRDLRHHDGRYGERQPRV